MKRMCLLRCAAALLLLPAAGCGGLGGGFANLSRAQQMKLWRGDPAKARQVAEQMRAKYAHAGPLQASSRASR